MAHRLYLNQLLYKNGDRANEWVVVARSNDGAEPRVVITKTGTRSQRFLKEEDVLREFTLATK